MILLIYLTIARIHLSYKNKLLHGIILLSDGSTADQEENKMIRKSVCTRCIATIMEN